MSALSLPPQERTAARVNGLPVSVFQSHRRWPAADRVPGSQESVEYEPVAVTVVAPVVLSLEDIAAVLFGVCLTDEELADDQHLQVLVADTVINAGSVAIEQLRCDLDEQTLDADEAAWLADCRERAGAVFCPPAAAQPASRRSRELAATR